jgi:hypothetical protein
LGQSKKKIKNNYKVQFSTNSMLNDEIKKNQLEKGQKKTTRINSS